MKDIQLASFHNRQVIFTDIDDTLTDQGFLKAPAYKALWKIHEHGFKVVPVTGRPAGWCEMIVRQWPVDGVIGENGAFYFRRIDNQLCRVFSESETKRSEYREKLNVIKKEILSAVPGAAVASDQFCRVADLAIDFAEDVPLLNTQQVQSIVALFEKHQAQAKVSSIHVNGWFGDYNKLSMCLRFASEQYNWSPDELRSQSVFIGDSPNDEPMFEFFPLSVAVSNISSFTAQMKSLPPFQTPSPGGQGFTEFAAQFLKTAVTE